MANAFLYSDQNAPHLFHLGTLSPGPPAFQFTFAYTDLIHGMIILRGKETASSFRAGKGLEKVVFF